MLFSILLYQKYKCITEFLSEPLRLSDEMKSITTRNKKKKSLDLKRATKSSVVHILGICGIDLIMSLILQYQNGVFCSLLGFAWRSVHADQLSCI